MNLNLNKLGIILFPSTRSLAFLDILRKNNIILNEVIVMGSWPFLSNEFIKESGKYDYHSFFNLNDEIDTILRPISKSVKYVSSTDINSEELSEILNLNKCSQYIFTGGGILKDRVLSQNIDFIHIHPGDINNYRGSTCFYYSYLNEGVISCTSFIMKKEIDKGEIMNICNISQNIKIEYDQKFFIDYIFDPLIRALTLEKLLHQAKSNSFIKTYILKKYNKHQYHIAHPMIRSLFASKINENYEGNKPRRVLINE